MTDLPDADSAIASPLSTGAAGNRYEALIGALYLADVLLEQVPPGLDGVARRLGFQRLFEGHTYDDLVLSDENVTLALSVKRQVTFVPSDKQSIDVMGSGLKALRSAPVEFSKRTRLLGVVTQASSQVREVIELSTLARWQSTATEFFQLVRTPGVVRKQVRARLGKLQELRAKVDDEQVVADDEELWRWLRVLSLRPIEDDPNGAVVTNTVNALAKLFSHPDHERARMLMSELRVLAADAAPRGASLDRAGIVALLPPHLQTGLRPAASADVTRILEDGQLTLSAIHTETAGVALDRSALVQAAEATLSQADVLVLSGASGAGKSALASLLVAGPSGVVAFAPARFQARSLPELEASLRLQDSLATALRGVGPDLRRYLIDGAERALDGERARLLVELVHLLGVDVAGGWQIVVTVREDSVTALTDLIKRAWPGARVATLEVPPVNDAEWEILVDRHPILRRFESRRGTQRVLRSSLMSLDLLLRSASSGIEDSEGTQQHRILTEAGVMLAVWDRQVRGEGRPATAGGSPDDRERALLSLAQANLLKPGPQHLSISEAPGPALAGLRSDGLIVRSPRGDQFTHDKFADWALAVALRRGVVTFEDIGRCGYPQTAGPGVRLWLEAMATDRDVQAWKVALLSLEDSSPPARWSEFPYEALISVAESETYDSVAQLLYDGDGHRLRVLLGALNHRAVERDGKPDPDLWDPALRWLLRDPERSVIAAPGAIETWLQGLTKLPRSSFGADERALMGQAAIHLARTRPWHSVGDETLRLIAITSPVIAQDAFDALDACLSASARKLGKILEDPLACAAMAFADGQRFGALAARYYCLDDPDDDSDWIEKEGIRNLQPGLPLSGWWRGPFYLLMKTSPEHGLRLVGRVADHATLYRNRIDRDSAYGDPASIRVDWPGLGSRTYRGGDQVYRWHRGTGVGPYAALSALAALERWMHEEIGLGSIDLRSVMQLALACSESIGVVAVCVSVVAAHIETVTDELDSFLSVPLLWMYERVRKIHEASWSVLHGNTDTDFNQRRNWGMEELASYLVIHASETRQVALRKIGDAFAGSGYHQFEDQPIGEVSVLHTRLWASALDHANWRVTQSSDSSIYLEHVPPAEVDAGLEALGGPGMWWVEVHGLAVWAAGLLEGRYSASPAEVFAKCDALRRLERQRPQVDPRRSLPSARAGIAAVVVSCLGQDELTADLKAWAREELLEASTWGTDQPQWDDPGMLMSTDPDRFAARGLLRLAQIGEPDPKINEALRALARNPMYEVREILAHSAWPLSGTSAGIIDMIADEMIRTARRLEGNADTGWRTLRGEFEGDVSAALDRAAQHDVDRGAVIGVFKLAARLVAAGTVSPHLKELVAALARWDLRTRSSTGAHHRNRSWQWDLAVAETAAAFALRGEEGILREYLEAWGSFPQTASFFLGELLLQGVGNLEESALVELWPNAVETIIGSGDWDNVTDLYQDGADLVRAMICQPRFVTFSIREWPPAASAGFMQIADKWVVRFGDWPDALGALAGYLSLAGRALDANIGLRLMEAVVQRHAWRSEIRGTDQAVEWLKQLRDREVDGPRYQALVDQLAGKGNAKALSLQRELEAER